MADPELEARLTALLAAGDHGAVATAIVREYGPGILGYLAATLRDDEAARDAFSEAAEELWKSLPRFAGKSTLKTWAYSIAYHCVLRQRRAHARRRSRPLRDSEYSKLAASVASLSKSFSRTAAERKLDVLRAGLTDEEHTLLVLKLDRGMSWPEIGEVLGAETPAAQAALRKRFQRLKDRLRERAEREGLIRPRDQSP